VTTAVWRWLGRIPFAEAVRIQERARAAVVAGDGPETLLFGEHEPVVTLGRWARDEHLLVPRAELIRRGVDCQHASRGGDITYHGPGQLVGYPIVRVRRGVVAHVTAMARAVGRVLADMGIDAVWRRETPGLWVGAAKICAFGVHVRNRVAMHGFALNVASDLSGFDLMVPCGLRDARVTSVVRSLPNGAAVPAMHVIAPRIARALGDELQLEVVPDIACAQVSFADRSASREVRRGRVGDPPSPLRGD
jgi:lipoyl(octanoyl) transferase